MSIWSIPLGIVLGSSLPSRAQEVPLAPLKDLLAQKNEQRITSTEEWKKRQSDIRKAAESVMGTFPTAAKRVDLNIQVLETAELERYTRKLITYQSEPGSRTPAYLCIPRPVRPMKYPAVLCLHPTDQRVGHQVVLGLAGKPGRQYAAELAERGFVTISPSYPHLANYYPNLGKLGYISGTMKAIWDNSRAIDLLESLPEVNSSHGVGAIGHSLGGHNAIYSALFDGRITALAVSCSFDSYRDYKNAAAANWYFGKGWCQIRYMPKMSDYRERLDQIPFDFPELLAALAPRPIYINAPLHDGNFRWRSVERCSASARKVYELFNAKGAIVVDHPNADHNFPLEQRNRAYELLESVLRP